MIDVLIADDHTLFRAAVAELLRRDLRIGRIDEAGTGDLALAAVAERRPDVVLLDLEMPGPGPIALLLQIKRLDSTIRVLILTAHEVGPFAVECLRNGADGWIRKTEPAALLLAALDRVARGRKEIGPGLAAAMVDTLDGRATGAAPSVRLSPREQQVLALIAEGKRIGEIARGLGLSVKTISTHCARLRTKLHCPTTEKLLRYALSSRLDVFATAVSPTPQSPTSSAR